MIRIAIAGATGYMGAELIRLLLGHPEVRITAITSERAAGSAIEALHPSLRGHLSLELLPLDPDRLGSEADAVFLALPKAEAMKHTPILRRRGVRVIDISADYRLKDAVEFQLWYGTPHADPSGLAEAVYGLPELHRPAIAGAQLIANPGCYPCGALLAVAPLLRSGLGRPAGIVIDAKSGVTGAGARAGMVDSMYLYTEANENLQAYKVAGHPHIPEIEQELSMVAGKEVKVAFTPHLVPLNRGLFTTAYVPLAKTATTADLLEVYGESYAGEAFVRVLPEGRLPTTRAVLGSNYCDVMVIADRRVGGAVCLSAIDNLGKGGSGQAVQNLNIMYKLSERTGLDAPPFYP